MDTGDFKNGNGELVLYYENGEVHYKGELINGRAHGKWIYRTNTGFEDFKIISKGLRENGSSFEPWWL